MRCGFARVAGWLLALAGSAFVSQPAEAQLLQASSDSDWTIIYKPTAVPPAADQFRYAGGPHIIAFDAPSGSALTRQFFINWSAWGDYGPWNNYHGWAKSTDGGVSWGAAQSTPFNLDDTAGIRRLDGTILAVPFWPKYPPTIPTATFTTFYHTSTDNATTWTQFGTLDSATDTIINGGVIDFSPNTCLGMRFHRGVLQEPNGDLYAPVYVRFSSDPNWRVALVKSTNGGQLWTYFSTIKLPVSSAAAASETTIVRCKNDDWLAVMRYDDSTGIAQLQQSRSTDHGLTWSASVNTPGLTANGVDPNLHLMPNGILVLSYGAQGAGTIGRSIRIAFSADGNGTTWSNIIETLTPIDNVYESIGYTSVATTGSAHRLLQFGDTGTSWSYSADKQSPNPYSIRQKYVDVVRTQYNRINLAGRVAAGSVTISTDMTYTDPAHPEAQIASAYGGSTEYWSGAFKAATTGSYTIDLQQSQTLTSVGVCLQYNVPESATIDYSTNGTTWTTLKTYTNAKHNALDYTDSTFTARYVRVNVTGGTSPIGLNEIELYSNADTFENIPIWSSTPHGPMPPGYTSNGTSSTQYGFAVGDSTTGAGGYQSDRSYEMYDGSSLWRCGVKKTVTATASKTFEFLVKPLAFASSGGAHQFALLTGAGTAVFQMAVFSDGSIKYFNGTAWVSTTGTGSPAGAGTVPLNAWSRIKVVATLPGTTAAISVNGVAKGNAGKQGTPTTMNGFSFGSGGTSPYGDHALFDDITIN